MLSLPWGPCRTRSRRPFLLDHPETSAEELNVYYENQHRLNLVLGGYAYLSRTLDQFSKLWDPFRPVSVLNLYCGRGDWAEHMRQWARRRRFEVMVHALDRDPRAVQLAKERRPFEKELTFDTKDMSDTSLLQAQQVDYVVAAMCLSRLSSDEILLLFKRANLLARRGFVIIDDIRDIRRWLAVSALVKVLPDVAQAEVLTLSVVRSLSVSETAVLVKKTGLSHIRQHAPNGLWSILVAEGALAEAPKFNPAVGWAGA